MAAVPLKGCAFSTNCSCGMWWARRLWHTPQQGLELLAISHHCGVLADALPGAARRRSTRAC